MAFGSTSIAAGNFVGLTNEAFAVTANVLKRKIGIIATFDPLKTAIVAEVPILVTSPEDVGDKTGFGFMAHRLAVQAFAGSKGVETWIIPQAEVAGVNSTGEIDFTGSTGVVAGVLYLYIAGIKVPVTITTAMTPTELGAAVVLACDANPNLPTTQTALIGVVTFESKTIGPWGNDISITLNWGANEATPAGITIAITAMASGTGLPDISTALNALGIGDNQNEKHFTDIIHGYGQDSTTLDAISTYNGVGNGFSGNYTKEVARPFRSLTGDVAPGSAGLAALIVISDGRLLDRTNGIAAGPDFPNHPDEIAACAIGVMANISGNRGEQSYIDALLPGIIPGDKGADRWTADYDNRNLAVLSGISPLKVVAGNVFLQNVVSFYRPASVPVSSNGYRSMRNISIGQNILNSTKANFEREKWKGISIVEDTGAVSNAVSAEKVRDIESVKDDLVALADAFAENAWLYTASYSKENLSVTERPGLTGFDSVLPVIFSGEGGILNTDVKFDISTAVLNS